MYAVDWFNRRIASRVGDKEEGPHHENVAGAFWYCSNWWSRRGSGVGGLDGFDADDDPHLVSQSTVFDTPVVIKVASINVEFRLEPTSPTAHFGRTRETNHGNDGLSDSVHGQVAGDVPDRLAEPFDFRALEGHVLELLRVEEVWALEVSVELRVSAIDAFEIDVDVESEVLFLLRRVVHGSLDVVESAPELTGAHVLNAKQGG